MTSERARELVLRHGWNSTAYQLLNPGFRHWYAAAGDALVGFTIDGRGRLVGESWIPLEGLTSAELKLYLHELARVCDWHEFRLTAQDLY